MTTTATKNFSLNEFKCPCCGEAPMDQKLFEALQELRDLVQEPITVTSGYRCPSHNKEIQGASGSYHCRGMAADIKTRGLSPEQLAKIAEQIPAFKEGGIGVYKSWVHLDVRGYKARWSRQ